MMQWTAGLRPGVNGTLQFAFSSSETILFPAKLKHAGIVLAYNVIYLRSALFGGQKIVLVIEEISHPNNGE